jgi:hypothetical protein
LPFCGPVSTEKEIETPSCSNLNTSPAEKAPHKAGPASDVQGTGGRQVPTGMLSRASSLVYGRGAVQQLQEKGALEKDDRVVYTGPQPNSEQTNLSLSRKAAAPPLETVGVLNQSIDSCMSHFLLTFGDPRLRTHWARVLPVHRSKINRAAQLLPKWMCH